MLLMRVCCGWDPIIEKCEVDRLPKTGEIMVVNGDKFEVLNEATAAFIDDETIYTIKVKPCSSSST
jgi:hypothetical protein